MLTWCLFLVLQGPGRQSEPAQQEAQSLPPPNDPDASAHGAPVDASQGAVQPYRSFLHYDVGPEGQHPVILTSKDFNEEAFDLRQRERLAQIAADQERAMFASREVDKRQRVVATELMQLESQRRQVQNELRGLQKQQRLVEDEFTEIERQQRAIEGKLLEMQLRQKQVEYETQLKELIYEANTPVGMSYVRSMPRQRSVPRNVGRSATPDTLRSYDSDNYALERPQSAQVPRRHLPRGGSLQRMDQPPRKIKRSSSLKKLFGSLGRSKDKQKDQYGDVDTPVAPKKRGFVGKMKKKVSDATYSFYEAQKPYETVKFKKEKEGGATAYSDAETPKGLPPSSKKSLHGKENKQPGGINIVRSNQQVNSATPVKITEKKSYMVEESTDYLRKTYLPRDEFAITSSKFDQTSPDKGKPDSDIPVKEDGITPRLAKKGSREELVTEAMGSLDKPAVEGKITLKEQANIESAPGGRDRPESMVSVKEDAIAPQQVKKEKEKAVDEAVRVLQSKHKGRPMSVQEDAIEPIPKEQPKPVSEIGRPISVAEDSIEPQLKEKPRPISVAEESIQPQVAKKEKDEAVKEAMGSLEASPQKGKEVRVAAGTKVDPEVKKATAAKEARLMKIEAGAETPLRQSMDTMESLESMTSDDGSVAAKYKELEASAEANDTEGKDEFGKWKVKRMDKADIDMPSTGKEGQEQPKDSKIAAAANEGKAKVEGIAADAKAQSARLRPGTNNKKSEAPAPPATSGGDAAAATEQVRLTNYDNIDFSDYYRNLAAGGGVVGQHALTTCGYSDCTTTSASDSGVGSLERPPPSYRAAVVQSQSMRAKPPLSTAGARLIIDSNRNNIVLDAAPWSEQGPTKPRSRSADAFFKGKIAQTFLKRSKSAEGHASGRSNPAPTVDGIQAQNGLLPSKDLPVNPPSTPQNTPESITPTESQKSTSRLSPKMLRRYFQPLRTGSPKESPKTTPKSTPTGTPNGTPGGSPSSTPRGSRRGTPKALRRILQPMVGNVGTVMQAVKTSWDRHRPRSRSGSRGRSSSRDGSSGSRDKSPDPFASDSVTTSSEALNAGNTVTIDDTVVVLRRDISKRRADAQKREKRLSRSMERTPGQETRLPEEMQTQPMRRSLSCDVSELDNLDLPYVSMTYLEDKRKNQAEMASLDYNLEYDALIKRMNMLAEVADEELKSQSRAQPQRIMLYDGSLNYS